MDPAKAAELKLFVDLCKSNPSVLHDPSLGFFKDYLQSLGAQIPREKNKPDDDIKDERDGIADEDDQFKDEIIESDIVLDEMIIAPDNDPPQKMGDPSVEVSEESRDAAQVSKAKAVDAMSEGQLEEAIQHLTDAILSNPTSAILYASRASVFLKMNKPNAAIRDADAALQINPDSAKGYKSRGMARAMLRLWEEAAKDLHVASKLDYDEEIAAVLKKVEPNAHKIEEHRRKYERLCKEREMKKAEHEGQRRRAETEGAREREKGKEQSSKDKASYPESLASLQEGSVISIHSSSELETKFKAASDLSRLLILYFTATWCGPCRFMAPLYTNLAGRYAKVVFLKVDIDELGDIARRWEVSSVPTFFFVKNGKEIDKVIGADKNELEKKLASHASKY